MQTELPLLLRLRRLFIDRGAAAAVPVAAAAAAVAVAAGGSNLPLVV